MNYVRALVQIVIVLLIILAGVGGALFLVKTKKEAEKVPLDQSLPVVEVVEVNRVSPPMMIKAQGEVFPPRETTLSASVGGEVVYVSEKYETGQTFQRGEVILKIDDVDYKTALVSAQTAERQIESTIKEAEVALKLEHARAQQAIRDWEKLGRGKEPSELLLRKPQIAAAEARLLSATASMDQARANIEQAQRNLARTVVKAPYHCQLSVKNLDLGALATVGMPLCTVFEQGSVKARVPVSVEDARFVSISSSEISASATLGGQQKVWAGVLERSENRIDPRTRSITMIARFDGEDMPPIGLLADFEIKGEKLENVFEVPRVALSGQDQVLVIDAENKLVFKKVVVARTDAKNVFISSGLSPGDRVCVTVMNRAIEGMKVQIATEE